MSSSYKQLLVWQKSKRMAVEIYRATDRFPKREWYGLTAQSRRAAVSIALNIAEGQGRLTKGEFRNFLGQARGSLLELETQLAIARDLGYLSELDHRSLEHHCDEVRRMLNGLLESLQFSTRNSKLETRN